MFKRRKEMNEKTIYRLKVQEKDNGESGIATQSIASTMAPKSIKVPLAASIWVGVT
jgi:hypothetical protein